MAVIFLVLLFLVFRWAVLPFLHNIQSIFSNFLTGENKCQLSLHRHEGNWGVSAERLNCPELGALCT